MKPGEKFEISCYEYLTKHYQSQNVHFHHEGGMDSTKSDIAVIKNDTIKFFIETKDSSAQSGQFVLIPDTTTESFIFSPRNRSTPTKATKIIIEYMNCNFNKFNTAGTAGKALNIDNSIFADWIINHYKNKNVKYFMSYSNKHIIFPIRKFAEYFNISAYYRIKKSGSSKPAQKDMENIKKIVSTLYPSVIFSQENKKLYAEISNHISTQNFSIGKYTYYFSKQFDNIYEIRRLSNTYNMNVIFSIKLKKDQDAEDLKEFENDI